MRQLAGHFDGVCAALRRKLVNLTFSRGRGARHCSTFVRVLLHAMPLQPNITVLTARTEAKSLGKFTNGVGGQERVLVDVADGEVGGAPVQINRGFHGARWLVSILCEQARSDAGEQIAAAAFGHRWISSRVYSDAAVW